MRQFDHPNGNNGSWAKQIQDVEYPRVCKKMSIIFLSEKQSIYLLTEYPEVIVISDGASHT